MDDLEACFSAVFSSWKERALKAEGELDKATILLRKARHEPGCYPSEGVHTEWCQQVQNFLYKDK